MEELIKDGALRLLTSEASCDVIISCRGYRLMAHKVILSIASPVLQDLLLHDHAIPTVIIFPEISGNTMSLILDYIYTGNVTVRSDIFGEFMGIVHELKLRVDTEILNKSHKYVKNPIDETIKLDCKYFCNENQTDTKNILPNIYDTVTTKMSDVKSKLENSKENENEIGSLENKKVIKRNLRKVPGLVPISTIKQRRILSNQIISSPWRPRIASVIMDPGNHVTQSVLLNRGKECAVRNDKNNNFKIPPVKTPPPTFREVIRNDKINTSKEMNTAPYHPTIPSYVQSELETEVPLNNNISSSKSKNNILPLNMKKNTLKTKDKIEGNRSSSIKLNQSEHSDSEEEIDTEDTDKVQSVITKERSDSKRSFSCEDCGKSFSQLRNFKYHRSIHEGTKEFSARCPECGKTFNDKGYLSSHMKIHRDRKEYGCPHCPKRFNQRVAYNMHLRIHTGIKPHECPTCGKTFSRKMLLKQHQRVHTGERPYSCPECGKSFADRSNMSLHARLHTGVKPYTCNLCSKSFTKKHHLKTHMNFHTGLKPYSCQRCGLAFSQSSNMRTHYKKCILKSPDATDTPANENT